MSCFLSKAIVHWLRVRLYPSASNSSFVLFYEMNFVYYKIIIFMFVPFIFRPSDGNKVRLEANPSKVRVLIVHYFMIVSLVTLNGYEYMVYL